MDLSRTDPRTADLVEQAIELLTEVGPALGRPLVDRIFDPLRRAILLIAGDKSGNWKTWYDQNIPIAEQRYAAHLATL